VEGLPHRHSADRPRRIEGCKDEIGFEPSALVTPGMNDYSMDGIGKSGTLGPIDEEVNDINRFVSRGSAGRGEVDAEVSKLLIGDADDNIRRIRSELQDWDICSAVHWKPGEG
jgi:hypothetical protein